MLCIGLSDKYSLVVNEQCVSYLTQLVTTNQIVKLVNSKSFSDVQTFNGENDSLIQAMVSLPDRVANRLVVI